MYTTDLDCDWEAPPMSDEERERIERERAEAEEMLASFFTHRPQEAVPDFSVWSPDPFRPCTTPFGALLEPDGYEAIRALKEPRTASYAKRMPQTFAVACALYDAVVVHEVWGEHVRPKKGKRGKNDEQGRALTEVTWLTHTAGKWFEKAGGSGFPDAAMTLIDIVKTLADPEAHAVGNKDVWTWTRPNLLVRHVRIDLDLDDVFSDCDIHSLQGEMRIVHDVFGAFGLTVAVMRTGNRGIQAIAPIPPMPRAHAGVLIHAIRHVLRGCEREWRVKDFQSNLDGIMRFPLGRHAWAESVSWMLAPDATVLPLECQAQATISAFTDPTTMDDSWVGDIGEFLAARRVMPWSDVPQRVLADLARETPDSGLIRVLRSACDRLGVGPIIPPTPVPAATVLTRPTLGVTDVDQTVTDADQTETITDAEPPEMKPQTGRRIPVNKARAWAVLNAGFQPGESFRYYMNTTVDGVKGRNAIGMALIAFDGDVDGAKEWLHKQAREVGDPSEAVVNDRIGLIDRCLRLDEDGNPKNNTYTTLQRFLKELQKTRKYRDMDGVVLPEEARLAEQVADLLVEKQRGQTDRRKKPFTAKSLMTIRHMVALMLMETRQSEDGVARASFRTLAARISEEWPEDATSAVDVSRQMQWIVKGQKCLVECFRTSAGKLLSCFSPVTYVLGKGLTELILVCCEKQE